MKRPALITLMLACLLPALAQEKGTAGKNTQTTPPAKGKSYALVVGISEYQASSMNLNYADKDARLFKDFLLSSGTVKAEHVDSLFNSKATGVAINHALEKLAEKSAEGDTVYLYFSGHGDIQNKYGKVIDGYFLGYDANAQRVYAGNGGLLSLKELQEALNYISGKKATVHLFLDACHSGFTVNPEGSAAFNQIAHGGFTNINRYLSSLPSQKSYEFLPGQPVQQGYFTYFLIKGLMGLADIDPKDNNISFDELSRYVRSEVHKISNSRQTPKFDAYDVYANVQTVKPELLQAVLNRTGLVQLPAFASLGKSSAGSAVVNLAELSPSEREFFNQVNQLLAQGDEGLGKAYALYTSNTYKSVLSVALHPVFKNTLAEALSIKPQLAINTILLGKNQEPPGAYFQQAGVFSQQAASLTDTSSFYYKIFTINARYLTAYSHIRNRNYRKYNEAEKLLHEALKLEPNSAFVLHGLGLVASYKNDHPLAEKYFKQAIELIPTWTYPRNSLGSSLKEQGRYKEAIQVFEEVIRMAPGYAAAYNILGNVYQDLARYNEAEKMYRRAMAADSIDISMELNNLGQLYDDRGNLKEAEKYYRASIDKKGNYGKTYARLGYLYAGLEDGRAEEYLKKAVEIEPFYADLITDLAGYYSTSSSRADKDRADALYQEAILNNPFEVRAYAGRGWNAYPVNNQLAEQYFKENVKVNAGKAAAWYHLAEWYDRNEKYTEAETNYRQTLKLNPYFYPAYTRLSDLYLHTNRPELAEKTLLDASTYFELSPVLFNHIGNFYYGQGKTDKALSFYKKALFTDADYAKAYGSLAYTALENSDYRTAIEQFKKANSNDPIKFALADFRSLFLTRMEMLVNAGKAAEARQALNEYMAALPSHSELDYSLARACYLSNDAAAAGDALQKTDLNTLRVQEKYLYWDLLGWISIDRDKPAEAKENFHTAASFNANPNPLGPALTAYLGKDTDTAKSLLDKALQQDHSALDPARLASRYSKKSVALIQQMAEALK